MLECNNKRYYWIDKDCNSIPLRQIDNDYLLNIRNFLLKINNMARIEKSVERSFLAACDMDSSLEDKDWYSPGSALLDIPSAEEVKNFLDWNYEIISKELKRRKLNFGIRKLV